MNHNQKFMWFRGTLTSTFSVKILKRYHFYLAHEFKLAHFFLFRFFDFLKIKPSPNKKFNFLFFWEVHESIRPRDLQNKSCYSLDIVIAWNPEIIKWYSTKPINTIPQDQNIQVNGQWL